LGRADEERYFYYAAFVKREAEEWGSNAASARLEFNPAGLERSE
jgi:hypothetical protein